MQRSFSNNAILYYGLVCSYEQQRKKLSFPGSATKQFRNKTAETEKELSATSTRRITIVS